jgi:hypothetical protein
MHYSSAEDGVTHDLVELDIEIEIQNVPHPRFPAGHTQHTD